EFPHVFVVGLEQGLLPHVRAVEEGTLDEERRLFYVAVTRGMKTLCLTYCKGRRKYGQLMPAHPSSFLRELPPELVIHEDSNSRRPVAPEAGRGLFAGMRQAANGAPDVRVGEGSRARSRWRPEAAPVGIIGRIDSSVAAPDQIRDRLRAREAALARTAG